MLCLKHVRALAKPTTKTHKKNLQRNLDTLCIPFPFVLLAVVSTVSFTLVFFEKKVDKFVRTVYTPEKKCKKHQQVPARAFRHAGGCLKLLFIEIPLRLYSGSIKALLRLY